MDGSSCCEQDRTLKVFNLVDWKDIPQDDIKCKDKVAKLKLENKDIIDGQSRIHDEISELRRVCQDRCERYYENKLGELNKTCDKLHRRLEAFEKQVSPQRTQRKD
jgi:hypothetical protein